MPTRLCPAFVSAAAALFLSACVVEAPPTAGATSDDPEIRLAQLASGLQRTVLEGAAAGAVVGPGFVVFYAKPGQPSGEQLRDAAAIGGAAGAATGAYVAHLQSRYAERADRLRRIRADLDRSSTEIAATVQVMREVLALQERELSELRAGSATASPAELDREIAEARQNLGQMQRAVEGATRRRAEFAEARSLVALDTGATEIDGELAALAGQIAAMRAIADELSEDI